MGKTAVTCLVVVLFVFTGASADVRTDYQAEFIVKLIDYVTWPDGAGRDTGGSFVIGVVGQTNLLDVLRAEAAKRAADKIEVKSFGLEDDFTGCQIIFMSTQDLKELPTILKKVAGKPILTVSEAEKFAQYGVMINFTAGAATEKAKFEANRLAAMDAGLKISAQLLKLGTVI